MSVSTSCPYHLSIYACHVPKFLDGCPAPEVMSCIMAARWQAAGGAQLPGSCCSGPSFDLSLSGKALLIDAQHSDVCEVLKAPTPSSNGGPDQSTSQCRNQGTHESYESILPCCSNEAAFPASEAGQEPCMTEQLLTARLIHGSSCALLKGQTYRWYECLSLLSRYRKQCHC